MRLINFLSSKFLFLSPGCLFHFSQAVWRNIQSNGLSKKYNDDEAFRLNVKKSIALAFVPLPDVIKGFELVAGDLEDEAEDFLVYFEKTWVGEPKRRGKLRHYHLFFGIVIFLRCGKKETTI